MTLASLPSARVRGLGSVVSSPRGIQDGALATRAFLAYLKSTEQPIKHSIFHKRTINRSLDNLLLERGGALGFSGGHGPLSNLATGLVILSTITSSKCQRDAEYYHLFVIFAVFDPWLLTR